jgi:hypothetical protein
MDTERYTGISRREHSRARGGHPHRSRSTSLKGAGRSRVRFLLALGAIGVLFAAGEPLAALTEAELLDRIRAAQAVTVQDAAAAVLLASGRLERGEGAGSGSGAGETIGAQSAEIDLERAASRAAELFPLRKAGTAPVSTAEYAYLLVEGFDLPQGLLYRLAPSPRYALRELRFRELIPQEYEATETLTGREALSLLARIRAWAAERNYGQASGGAR